MRECANMVLLIGFVMGTVYLSALKYTVPITPVKKKSRLSPTLFTLLSRDARCCFPQLLAFDTFS